MSHGKIAVGLVAIAIVGASVRQSQASSPPPAADAGAPAVATPSPAPYGTAAKYPTAAPLPPANPPQGLAVVAFPGSADAAWPLARALYANPSLRAEKLDDAQARILCGETPKADAPAAQKDLGEMVAALRGDDAPSRLLMAELARRFGVRALVAVWNGQGGHASARTFLPDSGTFDAATYAPDDIQASAWSGAVKSLSRAFASEPSAPLPTLATHEAPSSERTQGGRPFYVSPWFWGGIGAAALAAGAIYLTTRDTSSPTIHLEVQVPH